MYVQKLFSPWICVILNIQKYHNDKCINFPNNFKELATIDKQAIPYVSFTCIRMSQNFQKNG